MRYIDWKRGNPYVFKEDDIPEIVSSDMLFARKFSSDNPEVLEKLADAVIRENKNFDTNI